MYRMKRKRLLAVLLRFARNLAISFSISDLQLVHLLRVTHFVVYKQQHAAVDAIGDGHKAHRYVYARFGADLCALSLQALAATMTHRNLTVD